MTVENERGGWRWRMRVENEGGEWERRVREEGERGGWERMCSVWACFHCLIGILLYSNWDFPLIGMQWGVSIEEDKCCDEVSIEEGKCCDEVSIEEGQQEKVCRASKWCTHCMLGEMERREKEVGGERENRRWEMKRMKGRGIYRKRIRKTQKF